MKTIRVNALATNLLADGKPRTLQQIKDYINKRLRDGTSTNQLGNVLGKGMNFQKVENSTSSTLAGHNYRVSQWTLTDVAIADLERSSARDQRGLP